MMKPTILFCLLALAGCSHSNERPAASADDEVTPSEAEARQQRYSSGDEIADAPLVPVDSAQPQSDSVTPVTPVAPLAPVEPEPIAGGTPRDTQAAAGSRSAAAPDNTKVNERDRNDSTLTPMDQGSSESDTKITQRIRQAVVDDGALSFTAKNIKIITTQGKVTLRGPVNSAQERTSIETKATRVAGAGHVVNQLEVER